MQLSELGLNRWGYKDQKDFQEASALEASNNPNYQKQKNRENADPFNAENVQPGTVIKDVILIATTFEGDSLLISSMGEYIARITGRDAGLIGPELLTLLGNGYNYTMNLVYFGPNSEEVFTPDLGTPTLPWGTVYAGQIGDGSNKTTLYGSVIACPLPTVEEALPIIRKIPEPTEVGDRGHFGPGLYFDDLTFPDEVLWNNGDKKEIEHTKMIGLLMKAVVELTKKVDELERKLL